MVKWGVIGAGGIASRRTIPEGIIPANNAQLVAVMDVRKEVVEELACKFGVKGYFSEEELLKDKEVEAVYIATPAFLHATQSIKALQAGKHVLVEKPIALDTEEAEKMIEEAKKRNLKLGVGFMMRFHSHHQKFREMVEQGELGTPVMGRAQLSCWYPPIEGAWRQIPEKGGGGSLIDMGNHCIDLLEFIFNTRVKELICFAETVIHNYPVEDSAIMVAKFENGALGIVDSLFSIPDHGSKNRLELYGTKGSILAEGTIGQLPTGDAIAYLSKEVGGYDAQQDRSVAQGRIIEVIPHNTYQAEIEAFSKAVIEDEAPPISGEDGLWSQRVMLAAYESARMGKKVILE